MSVTSDDLTDWEVLPMKFQQSFFDQQLYPQNLLHRTIHTCNAGKRVAWGRLHAAGRHLFQDSKYEDDIDVRFREHGRDFTGDMDKQNVRSMDRLLQWFGIDVAFDTELGRSIVKSERKDPQSRFIYIYGDSSRSRLNVTKEMLLLILSYHQVMPAYLEFMLVFGERQEQPDPRFSGFKMQKLLKESPLSPLVIPALGRSGRHYQLCYNLKCVDLKTRRRDAMVNESDFDDPSLEEWSIRQAAFHHQFDVIEGTALWIVTKGGDDLQQRYKEMTAGDSRPEDRSFGSPTAGFRSTLAVHLMFCYWALQDWTGYIRWLEGVVDAESLMAVIGPRGRDDSHKMYDSNDVQNLQHWQERALLAMEVMHGNVDVMDQLRRFYSDLSTNVDFPLKDACHDFIDEFTSDVQDIINTLRMQITRIQGLLRFIQDRLALVTQHLQSQGTERMEALSSSMEKEAIVVRIITIVTLVYLPATFVSTFFSTDVIKYQNQEDGTDPDGTFSNTAMARWLQVALPLTFITLLFAWCAKTWAERQSLRQKYRDREPIWTRTPNEKTREKGSPKPGISPASTASTAASWWTKVAARRSREPCCELPSQKV